MSRSILTLAVLALSLGLARPALLAQDKGLTEEIARVLGESHKKTADAIAKILGKRIAQLEKSIDEKEKRIVALERQLAALKAEKNEPPKKPEPEKPEPPKSTGAFLGVGHVDHEQGARVTTVHVDSPAAAAKLQAGDVIAAINGEKITSETLGRVVTTIAPGQEIGIEFIRGDKKMNAKTQLVDRRKFFEARAKKAQAELAKAPAHVVLGVTIEEDGKGIFAYEVEDGFTGAAAGIQKGDRITHIGGKAVKTLDDAEKAVKGAKVGENLELRTVRGDAAFKIVVLGAAKKGEAKLVSSAPEGGDKKAPTPPKAAKKPGFLGVALAPADGGLRVETVVPKSSAAAYGLKPGDVVTKVDGKAVDSTDKLVAALAGKNAGDKVKLSVRRGDKTEDVEVVLGVRGEEFKKPEAKKPEAKKPEAKKPEPEKPEAKKPEPEKPEAKKPEPEKPEAKKDRPRGVLGIQARETGDSLVQISSVTPGGGAQKAGVKAGDLLLKVGDKEIKSFKDLADAVKSLRAGDEVSIRVRRADGKEEDLKVRLGAPLWPALDE